MTLTPQVFDKLYVCILMKLLGEGGWNYKDIKGVDHIVKGRINGKGHNPVLAVG